MTGPEYHHTRKQNGKDVPVYSHRKCEHPGTTAARQACLARMRGGDAI